MWFWTMMTVFAMASDVVALVTMSPASFNATSEEYHDEVDAASVATTMTTTIINRGGTGGSRGRRRPLRPTLSISERIVPIQLVETYSEDDHVRVPRRNQLRPQVLFAALDKDFDPAWMSVDAPAVLVEDPAVVSSSSSNGRHRKMMAEARVQVDHKLLSQLMASSNLTSSASSLIKTRAMLEEWLVSKASCPVRYVWDDVGPLFWPRWIKRGECVNVPERSCSWPLGMQCVPAESVTIHLLRFHCRPRSSRKQQQSSPTRLPNSSGSGGGRVVAASVDKLRLKMKHMRLVNATAAARRRKQRRANDDDVDKDDFTRHHKRFRCQWLKVPYPVTAECFCSC